MSEYQKEIEIRNGSALLQSAHEELAARLQKHPFLTACRNGTISMEQLKTFLEQQALYSEKFIQYLCALISNLDRQDEVHDLLENLAEEMGVDEHGDEPHSKIFARLLNDFDIDRSKIEPLPQTTELIERMFRWCSDKDSACGLGALCLGAEAIVPDMYSDIVAGFRAHGIDDETIHFFILHMECDDGHAETMMKIIDRLVEANQSRTNAVLQAAGDMIEARMSFFSAIMEADHGR
ncbi:TenA family transcriptional regulator [Aestuariispira ectoiniformans]|uniref:TenA family transcriptional regulator n=1 Tax=Aestuariispira ectoiniformans TaxID=2775080 RepID=UPI00223B9991|nr:iron-containing redox enzyme family protein [Aestuariispira ectoiniformans]